MMMRASKVLGRLSTVLMAGFVAACAAKTPWGDRAGVNAVPDGKERVVFQAAGFDGSAERRIEFQDPYQREEYAFFKGKDGARAEVLYIQTLELFGEKSVLDYNDTLTTSLEEWTYNKGRLSFDGAGVVPGNTKIPGAVYRRYNIAAENRQCVGYQFEWLLDPEDGLDRFDRVLLGYYCAAPGQKIADAEIPGILDGIGIRGETDPGRVTPFVNKVPPHSETQLQLARFGSPSGEAGNTQFPFFVQTIFTIGGGGEI